MSGHGSDRDARVREAAYSLWQDEGHPDGEHHRHWTAAEAMVDSEDAERKTTEGEPPGDVEEPAEVTTSAQALPPMTRKRKGGSTVGGV